MESQANKLANHAAKHIMEKVMAQVKTNVCCATNYLAQSMAKQSQDTGTPATRDPQNMNAMPTVMPSLTQSTIMVQPENGCLATMYTKYCTAQQTQEQCANLHVTHQTMVITYVIRIIAQK